MSTTTNSFPVTTILSSQVKQPEFRAICLEISYEEDWEVDFVTDDPSYAEGWCKLSTPEMLRIVKDAKRFVPRPKPRLPEGYHHKEW